MENIIKVFPTNKSKDLVQTGDVHYWNDGFRFDDTLQFVVETLKGRYNIPIGEGTCKYFDAQVNNYHKSGDFKIRKLGPDF